MDPARFKQLDSLLQSVLERPAEHRDAFLHEICAGDEALERELRSLVHLEREAGRFLDRPAIDVVAFNLARGETRQRRTAWTRGSAGPLPITAFSRRSARAGWASCTRPRTSGSIGLLR